MSGIERLQYELAQILHILDLGVKIYFLENFVTIAKASWIFREGGGCTIRTLHLSAKSSVKKEPTVIA